MASESISVAIIYQGWEHYQNNVMQTIGSLTEEQLDLRVSANERTIRQIATHVVRARVSWFHDVMEIGDADFNALGKLDHPGQPIRTASELAAGMALTWATINDSLQRWTLADLSYTFSGIYEGEPYSFTRQWILWHLLEHDLHHGGEIALTLGANDIAIWDI